MTGLLSEITAYTPGEIVPKAHAFYDYDAKYTDPDGAELVIPAMPSPDTSSTGAEDPRARVSRRSRVKAWREWIFSLTVPAASCT